MSTLAVKQTKRSTLVITLKGTKDGLGLRIIRGRAASDHRDDTYGIFIKEILQGKLAAKNGKLKVGDQILQVNSESLVDISNEKGQTILRECAKSGSIELLIARDKQASDDFHRLSQPGSGTVQTTQREVTIDSGSELEDEEEETMSGDTSTVAPKDVRLSYITTSSDDMSPPPLPTSRPPTEFFGTEFPDVSSLPDNEAIMKSVVEDQQNIQKTKSKPKVIGLQDSFSFKSTAPVIDTTDVTDLTKNTQPVFKGSVPMRSAKQLDAATQKKQQDSRFSVNPGNKFKLEKLLWAIEYIGNKLTAEQLELLHKRLQIDSNGRVVFSDFLQVVKEILPTRTIDEKKLMEAFIIKRQDSISNKSRNDELIRENQELHSTVQQLQNEVQKLTDKNMAKMLAAKSCELEKLEAANRRYQVAIDILRKFVEDCHEALVKSKAGNEVVHYSHGSGLSAIRGDQITGNPRPPQYLSKHVKKTSTSLANEAKEALAEVRRIMEFSVLPYGWEEEYDENGRKYYINHMTQRTSWVHPVTKHPPLMTQPRLEE